MNDAERLKLLLAKLNGLQIITKDIDVRKRIADTPEKPYSSGSFSNYLKGISKIPDGFLYKIIEAFKPELKRLNKYEGIINEFLSEDEKVKSYQINEMSMNYNDDNSISLQAILAIAESNRLVAQSNVDLTQMLKNKEKAIADDKKRKGKVSEAELTESEQNVLHWNYEKYGEPTIEKMQEIGVLKK